MPSTLAAGVLVPLIGCAVVVARQTPGAAQPPASPPFRVQVVADFESPWAMTGNGHSSGRIAFSEDGYLFFTNGERQRFDPAQDPTATPGKVLRLKDDGTPSS